mgnify:CR=1 FL=1|tara:strand:+ start:1418 stop:1657 length:240 start_codon:yes stop_codon:yes gene_type:complete
MNFKIRNSIRIARVKEMKNPTIVMNDKDLEVFIKQIENQVNNLNIGDNPTYEGIPIKGLKHIEQGKFIVYDGVVDDLFN